MRIRHPSGASKLSVTTDEIIELELDDLPGAGFLWSLETSGPLEVHEPDYASEEETLRSPVGGASQRLWQVSATGAGQGEIRGLRRQPWEPEGTDQSFVISVRVTSS